MARDCRLLTPHFTAKRLARIFEYVWARDLRASLIAAGAIPESTTVETVAKDRAQRMEVDCRQFVEILIRIAHQRMPSAREREELLAELELDREADVERRRAEGAGAAADKHAAAAGHEGARGSVTIGGELNAVQRQMDALTRASISIAHTGVRGGPGASGASGTTAPNGASASMNPAFEWGTPLFPSTRPGLALRLFHLIRCRLMPAAARLNVDQFRAQYKRIEVSALYKKHGAPLRRLFYRYAKLHSVRGRTGHQSSGGDDELGDDGSTSGEKGSSSAAALAAEAVWTNTIDYKEFVQMLRDSKLIDGRHLTLQTVYAIFSNVQADLAKVAPQPGEAKPAAAAAAKDKDKRGKRRGTMPRKLELPSSGAATATSGVSTTGESAAQSTAASSHAGSASTSRVGSRVGSRRGSVGATAEWGSGAGGRHASGMSLHDLDLESLAAAAAVAPTDEQILAQSATSHTELIFNEFLEALAAIAAIRHPNPYKPLHVRIAHFLERDLLPWISLIFSNQKE